MMNYLKKIWLLLTVNCYSFVVLAERSNLDSYRSNRGPADYLRKNFAVEILMHGGYITLGILSSLITLAVVSKKAREYIIAFFLAAFFFLCATFVLQAIEDFVFLPVHKE